MFIDLSHPFEDGMPGFRMAGADGSVVQYTAKIRPFLTHERTLPKFDGRCSFEMTEITLQTSIGTYLDAPRHRYPDGRDIGELALEDVILPARCSSTSAGAATGAGRSTSRTRARLRRGELT